MSFFQRIIAKFSLSTSKELDTSQKDDEKPIVHYNHPISENENTEQDATEEWVRLYTATQTPPSLPLKKGRDWFS